MPTPPVPKFSLPGLAFANATYSLRSPHRQILVDQHHQRQASDDGDVPEIRPGIVGLMRHQRRVDRLRGHRGGQPEIAVRRSLCDDIRADDAAAAGAVLDHERLAELLLQLMTQCAGEDVGRAGGRRGRKHPHQACRPRPLRAGGSHQQHARRRGQQCSAGERHSAILEIGDEVSKRKHRTKSKIRTRGHAIGDGHVS